VHDDAEWARIVQGLRDGDREVLFDFWKQYGQALQQVAERNLAPGMRRRVGADDVVQSACRTFLRRAQVGQFELADSEELWRLLCAITLNKVREQTRFHLRQKRGLGQEIHAVQDSINDPNPAAAKGPTPAEAAAFGDQLEQLLLGLDAEERKIVDLKLQDFTQDEIAQQLGCSERTVRRVLKRVQARWIAVLI